MHNKSKNFKILSVSQEGYVGVCTCCREFNLAYQNLLITFPEEGMVKFYHWLQEGMKNPDTSIELHHNKNRVFKGPAGNFYMTFNDEEIEVILNMIEEAMIVIEAKRILMFG